MLVLTRQAGETIMVGEEIVVKILGLQGNQVRLGIEAPSEVVVLRAELLTAAGTVAAQPTDIPKAVHHGSDTANTTAFSGAVKPRLTLVAAGTDRTSHTEAAAVRCEDAGVSRHPPGEVDRNDENHND